MSERMTDRELAKWFEERRLQRERDRQELELYIRERLAAGGAVIEAGRTHWSLEGTRHIQEDGSWGAPDQVFISECMTPEYLARHIVSRVTGFGWSIASAL